MSKEKQISLKMSIQSALEVLEILDNASAGYSKEYAPERIVRIREVISELEKTIN